MWNKAIQNTERTLIPDIILFQNGVNNYDNKKYGYNIFHQWDDYGVSIYIGPIRNKLTNGVTT